MAETRFSLRPAALRRLAQPAEAADMGLRLFHHHFDD
mgnify:CR=1 FL=1